MDSGTKGLCDSRLLWDITAASSIEENQGALEAKGIDHDGFRVSTDPAPDEQCKKEKARK
jgi:hypothetical protein